MITIAVLILIALSFFIAVNPSQEEKFTAFYILGSEGKAYHYPLQVHKGENCSVIAGVVNHEYAQVNYTLHINLNNSTILGRSFALQHNETRKVPLNYVLHKPGDRQKLEFLLFRDDDLTTPYRNLHLWVNVSNNPIELST